MYQGAVLGCENKAFTQGLNVLCDLDIDNLAVDIIEWVYTDSLVKLNKLNLIDVIKQDLVFNGYIQLTSIEIKILSGVGSVEEVLEVSEKFPRTSKFIRDYLI